MRIDIDDALGGSEWPSLGKARKRPQSKTIDVMIGTCCIENEFALLHNDRDFLAMEKHLGLMNALSSH